MNKGSPQQDEPMVRRVDGAPPMLMWVRLAQRWLHAWQAVDMSVRQSTTLGDVVVTGRLKTRYVGPVGGELEPYRLVELGVRLIEGEKSSASAVTGELLRAVRIAEAIETAMLAGHPGLPTGDGPFLVDPGGPLEVMELDWQQTEAAVALATVAGVSDTNRVAGRLLGLSAGTVAKRLYRLHQADESTAIVEIPGRVEPEAILEHIRADRAKNERKRA